jgi:hypothetical protein
MKSDMGTKIMAIKLFPVTERRQCFQTAESSCSS